MKTLLDFKVIYGIQLKQKLHDLMYVCVGGQAQVL